MTKLRRVSRKPLYAILGLSFALSLSYVTWNTYFRPAPASIMVIEPTPLTYGQTTISGGLHKDDVGNFVLVLPDRRVVTLDVKGIDQLDGSPVTISGILSPTPLSMAVQSITVTQ